MDLEKALEGHKNKDEILKYFEDSKTESAKEASKKANSEAQNLRTRLRSLETAIAKIGIENDENIESVLDEINSKLSDYNQLKEKSSQSDPAVKALQRDLENLNKKLTEKEESEKRLKIESFNKDLKREVEKALADNGAVDNDLVDVLLGRLEIDGVSELKDVRFKESGVSIHEGVKAYIDSKPYFKKNEQRPGGETGDPKAKSWSKGGTKEKSSIEKIAEGMNLNSK